MSISSWALEVDNIERWAFAKGVFSPEECSEIIRIGKSEELHPGLVGYKDTYAESEKYRVSNIRFLSPNSETIWIYERLTATVKNINQQFFNFELSGFMEGLQFTEYVAPAGMYDYHIDKTYKKIVRKLSLVVQLSDPETFDGGDFEYLDSKEPDTLPKEQGTVLFFPSWAMHRVTPVTRGARYSLVGWIHGPQFK